MLQSIHDKLKGWVAGVVLGAIGSGVRFLGHQLDLERTDLRGQGQRHRNLRQRGAPVLSAAARADRAPEQWSAQTMPCATKSSSGCSINMWTARHWSLAPMSWATASAIRSCSQEMAKVPAFQVDGKFDYAHALAVLNAQGRSPAEIEELFRRDVKLRQLDTRAQCLEFCDADRNEGISRAHAPAARARLADGVGGEVRSRRHAGRCGPQSLLRRAQSPTT